MKQYEICWAQLPDPIGKRPVLLLTRTLAYEYLNKVIVAEVTSTIRGIPQEVLVGRSEGLRRNCVVNLDNVHVILKNALRERLGPLHHAGIEKSSAHSATRSIGQSSRRYRLTMVSCTRARDVVARAERASA